jgi:hypothetical protein
MVVKFFSGLTIGTHLDICWILLDIEFMIQAFLWSLNFLLLSFMGSGSSLVSGSMLWLIFKFSSQRLAFEVLILLFGIPGEAPTLVHKLGIS